ncbi:MAG: acyltransferase [Pseudomonadota bacterium]
MTSEAVHPDAPASRLSHQTYRDTVHFGSLNGLRFLCIFGVLWHHAPVRDSLAEVSVFFSRGFLGVDFFFVLSGFLITTLLLREEHKTGRFSLRGFYWRRVLRILPVYFLVVTAVGAYYIIAKGQTEFLSLLPFYYLFLSNFLQGDIPMLAPTWSLSVEEQYYLIWPLLLLLIPRRHILSVLAILIALNIAAVTGGLSGLGIRAVEAGPLVFRMFNATYAPILIGSGLAIVLHNRAGFEALARVFGVRAAALVAFAILFVLLVTLPEDVTGWPNLVLHMTMAACLASIAMREDHVLSAVFKLPPVVRVGEISYGIYLYHLIALHIANVGLNRLGWHGDWSVFIVYSAITIVIAELSFRYYETPFLNLRHRKRS